MQTNEDTYERFERIWASDRQYVRRMLIGLARDIDLADDLLQETYLKAREGFSSCQGINDRAWICTIARNAFLAHRRRRYVRAETSSDDAECAASYSPVGTPDHLELVRVRGAMSKLDPNLRIALLMKHYCGFTYREIAEQTHCAVGTAKWRVSVAIEKLKEALGVTEAQMEMKCKDLSRTRMLDYLYGALASEESEAVKRHLQGCSMCRSRLDSICKILSALDALENELKFMQIVELDDNGMPALYTMLEHQNNSGESIYEVNFCSDNDVQLVYLASQGEELDFSTEENPGPTYPANTNAYRAKLPRPVAPGETWEFMGIFHLPEHRGAARQADGSWAFHWAQLTSDEMESAFVLAVRLPSGSHLVYADPSPAETRDNAPSTLIWRSIQAPNQQFECDIKYRLDDAGQE